MSQLFGWFFVGSMLLLKGTVLDWWVNKQSKIDMKKLVNNNQTKILDNYLVCDQVGYIN